MTVPIRIGNTRFPLHISEEFWLLLHFSLRSPRANPTSWRISKLTKQKPWSPSPLKACHWSLHPFASSRTDLCDHTCVVQVFYWTDMSYCRTCSGAYVLHQMQHWYPAQTETAVGKQPMPWGAVDPAKLTKIQPREQLTETTVGKQPTPWGAVDPAKLTQIQPREHFLSSSCTIDMIWSTLPVDNSAKIQGPASSDDCNHLTQHI